MENAEPNYIPDDPEYKKRFLEISDDQLLLDRLGPVERDVIEFVVIAAMYRVLRKVAGITLAALRELENKGVLTDSSVSISRTRRGAMITIHFELKDINLRMAAVHRKYFAKFVGDKWSRWAVIRAILKAVEKEIDKSVNEVITSDVLPVPRIGEVEVLSRTPYREDEDDEDDDQQSGDLS